MDYDAFFAERLEELHREGRYRVFAELERQSGSFPLAHHHRDDGVVDVVVWCSNDYLGMGQHPAVVAAMVDAVSRYGAGAGGTRNISGTNHVHVLLESELAAWHGKEAALLFGSGYSANQTTLSTLGRRIPGLTVFSDELNHNSMIEGIRHGGSARQIFRHNDPADLDRLMGALPKDAPKLVAFESVYSMDGDIAPLRELCDVAEAHGAMTFLDEVHAVGMYGRHGAGVAERDDVAGRITIIQGTLAKAIGVVGGYIAASADLVDFVRSFGPGFIFSSAMPPAVAAGALASVRHIRGHAAGRIRLHERAMTLKRRMERAGLPVLENPSHIVPLMVGDAVLCKQASDELLYRHNIYVQPINFPTVPKGTERLRFTATPFHDDAMIDQLIAALVEVWGELGLKKAAA